MQRPGEARLYSTAYIGLTQKAHEHYVRFNTGSQILWLESEMDCPCI